MSHQDAAKSDGDGSTVGDASAVGNGSAQEGDDKGPKGFTAPAAKTTPKAKTTSKPKTPAELGFAKSISKVMSLTNRVNRSRGESLAICCVIRQDRNVCLGEEC